MIHRVLITGGSGLIGTQLTDLLLQRGHEVVHLTRSKHESKVKVYVWNIEQQQIDRQALEGVDTIIHLAGAGVADKPWTEKRKKEILETRTKSTRLLYDELRNSDHQVKTFLCASGIGYYGSKCGDHSVTEGSSPGNDFLANVSKGWENEADMISTLGIRVVKIRTGLVLSAKGGALEPLARTVKFYVGAPLGSGKQYMSWVHIHDHCSIFIQALESVQWKGAYNSVAPQPVTNAMFTKALAKVLKKPLLLPRVPAFVLKLILGEMAAMVLDGCKISSSKVIAAGYDFKFPDLEGALHDLLI